MRWLHARLIEVHIIAVPRLNFVIGVYSSTCSTYTLIPKSGFVRQIWPYWPEAAIHRRFRHLQTKLCLDLCWTSSSGYPNRFFFVSWGIVGYWTFWSLYWPRNKLDNPLETGAGGLLCSDLRLQVNSLRQVSTQVRQMASASSRGCITSCSMPRWRSNSLRNPGPSWSKPDWHNPELS